MQGEELNLQENLKDDLRIRLTKKLVAKQKKELDAVESVKVILSIMFHMFTIIEIIYNLNISSKIYSGPHHNCYLLMFILARKLRQKWGLKRRKIVQLMTLFLLSTEGMEVSSSFCSLICCVCVVLASLTLYLIRNLWLHIVV